MINWAVEKMNILQNVIPQHDETQAIKGALYKMKCVAWKTESWFHGTNDYLGHTVHEMKWSIDSETEVISF